MPKTKTKICMRCKRRKPLEKFSPAKFGRFGRASHCKFCKKTDRREYRVKNPEKVAAYRRKYYYQGPGKQKMRESYLRNINKIRARNRYLYKILDPERRYFQMLKKKYGLSRADYEALFEKQKGRCAICRTHDSEVKGGLCVDHCHVSNKVRSLLCLPCNSAVGMVRENAEVASRLLEYIRNLDPIKVI